VPDPDVLLRVMLLSVVAAAGVAVLVPLVAGRLWRSPVRTRVVLGAVLAAGAAFFVGARMLDVHPQWPPAEDRDRFLLLLLPAVVLVESLAAPFYERWWLVWLLRLIIAAGAARVLLHNSTYLIDSAGPGTRRWSDSQAVLILSGSAAALLGVWVALDVLVRKGRGTSVCVAVAGTCAAAGVTVMLSGYLTGGQLGLPLAGALTGAALATWFFPAPGRETGALAVGVVGLFGLLVIGRFFGELSTPHALVLFAAPLLCWLPEVPPVRRLWAWARGVLRVALVVLPVAVVVTQAWEKHKEDSRTPSSPWEGTKEDYEQFEGPQPP
jgi:hypothetical protein